MRSIWNEHRLNSYRREHSTATRPAAPSDASEPDATRDESPGARILATAYELFSHAGIRAIGVDRIIEDAHVAKRTFYRHYRSKDDLVVAFLEERWRRWTRDWLEARIERIAPDPMARTLALFDALDEWFRSGDYEGCAFIRTVHEIPAGPLYEAAVRQMELVREMLAEHAAETGVAEPESFAYQMQILMMGAMVSALRGDLDAARRAREIAVVWLEHSR
jgi:AcrR family transcriptional regulator